MGLGGVARGIIRAASSIIGAIIPFSMMSSYMYPGYSFGSLSAFKNIIPNQVTTVANQLTSSGPLASLGPISHLFPFAAAGGGALVVWMVLSQVLGRIQSMTYSHSAPRTNPSDVIKNFGINVPYYQSQNTIPEKLPDDITKVQYTILRSFQQGYKKPKNIEKMLSVDKKEIEKEIVALKSNGYLSEKNKLTSKGLDVLTPRG